MADSVKFIKMQRGDIIADVHPDMYADYFKHGWVELTGGTSTIAAVRSVENVEIATGIEQALVDAVDDRSLSALQSAGITTAEAFLAASDEALDGIPYLTPKRIAKARKMMSDQ